jgi:UDP-glucose 4-epimerase
LAFGWQAAGQCFWWRVQEKKVAKLHTYQGSGAELMAILVTGGAGYIGSHACLELLQAGREVVVVDNLSNSTREPLDRVQALAGRSLDFHEADLRDPDACYRLFRDHTIESVIHFAGLKAVAESVSKPSLYYENNVLGSRNLLQAMDEAGTRKVIFSSSATVYGEPESVPVDEGAKIQPINPYGENKRDIEIMLGEYAARGAWKIAILRYFNPVGAHESGRIGEDPLGVANNLVPNVARAAIGQIECLNIWGDDYPTVDGTGVRDYIHVMDLVQGHLSALDWLENQQACCEVFNLGCGQGYSVLQVIQSFEKVSGKTVPYRIEGRRDGDTASCYADASRAEQLLGWKAERGIDDMMRDTWRWQEQNPRGYRG